MSVLYLSSTIIISLSILFTQTTHPLALGMTLLIQTVIICGTTSMLAKTTWFSYILFLIFLGAMLVLFIYVASLAPNEAFSFSSKLAILIMVFPSIGVIFFLTDPMLTPLLPTIESSFALPEQVLNNFPASLSSMYNPQSMNLTLFIIMYLLLTLIVAVKIASTHFGALRLT
uniref:NADH-ubiquinone oxidoreductase chain 6 n=1 Tax=Caridina cf. nilotica HMG-2016 TaxID=1844717 RepID=A0A182BT59_9EUCA|nr:NADH dehydrogenase subunit 6 [Caridina cf. nilotica HMG-2016]ANC75343.1 NADH dehydrogenase subunit 6 [Caridina cf. nilotica HMG-2016]